VLLGCPVEEVNKVWFRLVDLWISFSEKVSISFFGESTSSSSFSVSFSLSGNWILADFGFV